MLMQAETQPPHRTLPSYSCRWGALSLSLHSHYVRDCAAVSPFCWPLCAVRLAVMTGRHQHLALQSVQQNSRRASDMVRARVQAAELRAAGEPDQALRLIERVLEVQPGHPRAHFAAGQLHAGQQRWAAAEQAYVAAAQLEAGDAEQQARCWFGAGAQQQAS